MASRLRGLTEGALFAAAYAVLTWILAPVAYGPLQFRLSEVLRGAVVLRPRLAFAMAVGNFLANLRSPYAGPWELLFMPAVNLVGGLLAARVGRRHALAGAALYALVIAAAVGLLLHRVVGAPYLAATAAVAVSELVLVVGGMPVARALVRALQRVPGQNG